MSPVFEVVLRPTKAELGVSIDDRERILLCLTGPKFRTQQRDILKIENELVKVHAVDVTGRCNPDYAAIAVHRGWAATVPTFHPAGIRVELIGTT